MSTTRRDFLKASLGATTLASVAGFLPAGYPLGRSRSAFAATGRRSVPGRRDDGDTILVVVQLAGGNDGLNTVIPYEDDQYGRNRRTLRFTDRQVHKIGSLLGLHPKMQAFARLYKEGYLSIVQGVGYPNHNQSHPRSMEIWQTARPEETNCQTGWLGRAADSFVAAPDRQDREDHTDGQVSVPAVFVGQIEQPFALNAATMVVPSVRDVRQCILHAAAGPVGSEQHRRLLSLSAGHPRSAGDTPLLDFLQASTLAAYDSSRRLEEVARSAAGTDRGLGGAAYPTFPLAESFATVAQLIRAELGIRIFYTELGGNQPGGFDNHANQLGNHGALLHELSESVAALVDDLQRDGLLDRVLLITFSEFGRTLAENGRRGTGHGIAAPMFLAGGRLKGGLVGEHPSLTDLVGGSPMFHTDFRRVYATVLDCWLGLDSRTVLGGAFEPLDLLDA